MLPARAGLAANGFVEVGFIGAPPQGFQNVLLNVQRVRINPNPSAAPDNGKWAGIPVPPGIGGVGQESELQIDLNGSQNVPQMFNTAGVRPDIYKIAELILDPENPGTLVPNCPSGTPLGHASDGCINYPIQLAAGTSVISVVQKGPGGLVAPKSGHLAQLILQVNMVINSAPTTPGAPYTVTVTLATVPNETLAMLGTVTGTVSPSGSSSSSGSGTTKVGPLTVTAETIGTNTPIASARVQSGKFTLFLPAAGGLNGSENGFGTLYDLAVGGGGDTYGADRLVPLYPGQSITDDFKLTGGQTLGTISGTIYDNCVATKTISGATLQLLKAPQGNPSITDADCLDPTTANQCVTVATATTDNVGDFPMPGTLTVPAEFANVPVPSKDHPYAMEVSAPGYDPVIVEALPTTNSKGGTCRCPPTSTSCFATGTTYAACKLALNTGYISGTVPITPPPSGQTTVAQVWAEDTGTNNIESALPMPITVTSTSPDSFSFTLNVPTSDYVPGGYDLFASTVDYYQGVADPYQGHNYSVLSGVAAPAPPTGHSCNTVGTELTQTIDCVGHGSVTGSVANPNLGTSVVLEKLDPNGNPVQITNTMVRNQPPNTSATSNYSFCAPADMYQVQKLQLPLPDPSTTPSSSPTPGLEGSAQTVVIPPPPLINGSPSPTATPSGSPSPTATPTPTIKCPTTCQNPDGSCPGICSTVVQPL